MTPDLKLEAQKFSQQTGLRPVCMIQKAIERGYELAVIDQITRVKSLRKELAKAHSGNGHNEGAKSGTLPTLGETNGLTQ